MCVEIQFCTHHRLWDVLFSLNKSRSLSTTGQALWHLYILSPVIFPLTHMYSVEPSSRRLNCTEVETGQRRKAPSPRCMIPFNSFIHGNYKPTGGAGGRGVLLILMGSCRLYRSPRLLLHFTIQGEKVDKGMHFSNSCEMVHSNY